MPGIRCIPMVLAVLSFGATPVHAAAPVRSAGNASVPATALRLPADIVYAQPADSDRAVTFRHATHVAIAGNRCVGCHPQPFPMLRRLPRITHAEMDSGRSCGTCHDARSAFGVKDPAACQTCHADRSKPGLALASGDVGAKPAGPYPKVIRFTRGQSSPGQVGFRHDRHPAKDGCASCHPKLFAMKASSGKPGGAMHEATACGACHDGRAAFGVEETSSCARCHRAGAGS